jgi:hypothetical protein
MRNGPTPRRSGRQIVAQRQVLMDDLDAVLARLHRLVQDQILAVHLHRAMARGKVAGDHLDQRRLAGAVVAHQADHLSGLDRQRHVVDRLDGAEVFRDVGEFENRHQPSCLPVLSRPAVLPRPRSPQLLPETALSPIYAHAFLASTAAPFEKSVL